MCHISVNRGTPKVLKDLMKELTSHVKVVDPQGIIQPMNCLKSPLRERIQVIHADFTEEEVQATGTKLFSAMFSLSDNTYIS